MPQLREYQQTAVDLLSASGRGILAYPPGTGKTGTVATWLGARQGLTLIVVPNGPVLPHWVRELERFADLGGLVGTGTPSTRSSSRLRVRKGEFGALVLNYELLRQDIGELLAQDWDQVVFDESHRLKNRKALVFKAAAKLARRTPRLALVTGTPILNRADELWTSLHMLQPDRYKSFWRWARYHFNVTSKRYRGHIVEEVGDLLPGHAEMLREELSGLLIQHDFDRRPPAETYLTVKLSAQERKAYQSMLEKTWMALGDGIVIAPNAVSKSTRLRQLASDWTVFGPTELGAKGKAAVQLVEDLDGEQAVIFCAFRSTATALANALPGPVAMIHGGLNAKERDEHLRRFKAGESRTMVGTLATMGEGIDGMQVARHAIFLDRDWTPARNDQAIGRVDRLGQQGIVNVIHLVAEDTIDQVVADALARKVSVIQAVLGCHTQRVPSHAA